MFQYQYSILLFSFVWYFILKKNYIHKILCLEKSTKGQPKGKKQQVKFTSRGQHM